MNREVKTPKEWKRERGYPSLVAVVVWTVPTYLALCGLLAAALWW